MNKDVKDLWVAALRSGEYKQGKDFLQKNDRYCCLGVLCKIAPSSIEINVNYDNGELFGESLNYQKKVKLWSGIKTYCGEIFSLKSHLACMNDEGKTFEEIADIIEKNWENL